MRLSDLILHLYLPLLTQETAVMGAAFAYGVRHGVSVPVLATIDMAAVLTDLALVFLPVHFMSQRLHDLLIPHVQERYTKGQSIVSRRGAFFTAAVAGFVMPSVSGMIVVGLLRLPLWRALLGLFAGSTVYAVIPLLVALPLASALPAALISALSWAAPVLAGLFILVSLVRWLRTRHEAGPQSLTGHQRSDAAQIESSEEAAQSR